MSSAGLPRPTTALSMRWAISVRSQPSTGPTIVSRARRRHVACPPRSTPVGVEDHRGAGLQIELLIGEHQSRTARAEGVFGRPICSTRPSTSVSTRGGGWPPMRHPVARAPTD